MKFARSREFLAKDKAELASACRCKKRYGQGIPRLDSCHFAAGYPTLQQTS